MRGSFFVTANRRTWQRQRRTLLALRRHLLQEHLARMRAYFAGAEAQAEGRRAPEEITFVATLLADEPDALREILDALDRIDRGTYGRCEATGETIPAVRLRAVPWTRFARETPAAAGWAPAAH
ncbi:MAG TPA: TraR/DksA C4-type zinc finger protein [Lacunisphaera sp.]|nr:TraR/DksA C4-type zinc finger protein [Lacunisphaera sp.]